MDFNRHSIFLSNEAESPILVQGRVQRVLNRLKVRVASRLTQLGKLSLPGHESVLHGYFGLMFGVDRQQAQFVVLVIL